MSVSVLARSTFTPRTSSIEWVGTLTDVHDRKEAAATVQCVNAATREAEKRFRMVHDASPEPFFLFDVTADAVGEMQNAHIAYANAFACRLMDTRAGSLDGWTLIDAFPDAVSSGCWALCAEVHYTGVPQTTTWHHDAAHRWLRIVIVKAGGGFCLLGADVSELKATEAELRERIGRNQRQAVALVDDLVERSEIEGGRLEFEPSRVSRLRQAIVNLVSQAIARSGQGTTIVIRAVMDALGVLRRIEVQDSAAGIAVARVFEPFAGEGDGEATGLELVIARGLCLAMGYELAVGSGVEEGSTFTIHIRK